MVREGFTKQGLKERPKTNFQVRQAVGRGQWVFQAMGAMQAAGLKCERTQGDLSRAGEI
jgi:hypothetical protein